MDSSYPHPQAMGQSPFFYYNPDPKSNTRQHGNFTQQMPMYQKYQHFQVMPSTPTYSRPSSSCSQPQQMYYSNGYQMNIVSPQPLYQHAPRLMVESNMHESDMYYYPATPPLSASGSPSSCDILPTPVNHHMFYGMEAFEGVKEGCQGEVQSENLAGNEWARCGSPPLTPVFINHPNSLSASELLSATSCPSLSPSPTPYSPSATSEPQQDFDFCGVDPKNLTVASANNLQSPTLLPIIQAIKPFSEFPAFTLCGADEDHKYMLGEETFTKPAESHSHFQFTASHQSHGLPEFDQFSDLDSESEFVNGLVNFPASEHVQFLGNKRQRTGSDLTTVSLDNEDDFEQKFEEFDEQFAVACLPSPPVSESDTEVKEKKVKKEKRTRKSKKARYEEDREFDNLVRSRKYTVPMNAAAGTPPQEATNQGEQAETAPSQSGSSEANAQAMGTGSDAGAATPGGSAPINRRGRKQSLTEDPSKTFVCELCNRRFRRQEHLKRHYRSLHSHDKPFECHECGKKFSRSDNLAQHARTHGTGAIIMGVLEDGEMVDGQENGDEAIHALGSVLFKAARDASGSESEQPSETSASDNQTRKKRKRSA